METVRLRSGRRVTVMVEACSNCGERFYGPEAMDRIDAAMLAERRRTA